MSYMGGASGKARAVCPPFNLSRFNHLTFLNKMRPGKLDFPPPDYLTSSLVMDSGPDASPGGRMTPLSWRVAIGGAILLLGITAYFTREFVGLRGQAAVGVVCFFGLVAMFSSNLRAVNWRTIGWG